MKRIAGIIGIALACAGGQAFGHASAYTAISVPGNCFATQWDVNANVLSNTADYLWTGTVNILSNSGSFKFAANRSWAVNWGGSFTLHHVPARGVGSLSFNGGDLSFNSLPSGAYAVTFHEQTATFDLAPVVPAPNPLAIQVIGSFNGDGAAPAGAMTNVSGSIWKTTVNLDAGADFLFKVTTASGSNFWGALAATDILSMPFSGGNPCGVARYSLGTVGGTFAFTFDPRSNTFSIAQTQTNEFSLASVTAAGSFVAGTPPDINLTKLGRTLWQSDFTVTNAASFTLFFIGREAGGGINRYWGATNAAPLALPATGYMLASASSNGLVPATITAAPGNYRLALDSASGEFSVQQRYTASGGINYLQNPSFENVAAGNPVGWGVYNATSGEQADFGAHSGARCGLLKAKTAPADPDLGNFDQTTAPLVGLSGQTFRVSASFRTKGNWTAETVRIIVEWKDAQTNTVSERSAEVTGLGEQWKPFALEAIVPSNHIKAKILIKYDGAPGSGYLLVDDAEARIAASRFQDFNSWGSIGQFTNISPDWAVTSGKTLLNAAANAPTGGVVISKYIEGSDNNKAIEIYNGTGAATDLAAGQYVLQQYNNGSATASVSIALSGTLGANKCLVVSRLPTPTNAYPPHPDILAAGDLRIQTNALTFNGDDVVVLRKGGVAGPVVDRVGQVGPLSVGSSWALYATDHSLHRKSSVFWVSTNSPTNAFALSEWTALPKDTLAELGIHFFSLDDPGGGVLPTGYSLLLNTNASLITPMLDGGVGDLTFYARAQGAVSGTPLQLAIETATSQTSPNWTTHETLSLPLTATNFTRLSSFAPPSAHTVMRIRHIGDGSTNRVRLDDVLVSESYAVRRTENFAAWTNYLGAPVGTYSIAEWTIQNAQISTNGPYGNICADLHPSAGSVTSPTFEAGVGTVTYWLSQHPQERGEVRAVVLASTNQGASWSVLATNSLPAPSGTNVLKTNLTVAAYLPVPSSVRISASASPNPFVVDNIDVAIPSISRILTFNDFLVQSTYLSYEKNGWNLTDTAIVTNLLYSGYSGRVRNGAITSPYIDGIGVLSFYYSQFSGDSTAKLKVEVSANGSSWTVLDPGLSVSGTTEFYSHFNTNAAYHYVRLTQTTKDKRIHIDQIEIGKPSPVPSCTVAAALSPSAPAPNEGFYLTADAIPKNGADILSVDGAYRIGTNAWISLPLTPVTYGTFRSELLPPRPAGTKITFKASARYAGAGAIPGSTTYTTNTAYSSTNSITISSVKRGTVWINEIFYAPYEGEEGGGGIWGDTPYDHEFIELCGVAGTSITNWKVQLLFCSASDVQKNRGQPVYATYAIPSGTVLSNTVNGFGFYVIGDQQLKDAGRKVNQALTVFVPTNVAPTSIVDRDHIHDRSGIVRLLDQYSNVVYSLAYGGYDTGSEHLLVSQSLTSNTNSLSLSGTASSYAGFLWNDRGALTIGEANSGQTLVPDTGLPPMRAWHTPAAFAETALQGNFHHFHPVDAAQSDTLFIHYAYTNSDFNYASIDGRVHHRKQGAASWSTALKQVDFPGNYDTNGIAYLRAGIPAYAYKRLDTLEYVIEAIPNKVTLSTAYLGTDGSGSSMVYDSLDQAKLHPFRYTFPIADPIEITRIAVSNAVVRLVTDGNDTQDPIVTFRIRSTTNLLLPTSDWTTLPIQSMTRTNEQNYFTLTNPPGPRRFFAVQPLWP